MRAKRPSVPVPDPLPFLQSLVGRDLKSPPNLIDVGFRRLPPSDDWTADTWQAAVATAWRERWEPVVRDVTQVADYAEGVGEIGEPAFASVPFCLRHLAGLRDPIRHEGEDDGPLNDRMEHARNSLMHAIINAGSVTEVVKAIDVVGRHRLLATTEILHTAQVIASTMAARHLDLPEHLRQHCGSAQRTLSRSDLVPAAVLFSSGDGHWAARAWAEGMVTCRLPVADEGSLVPAGSYGREDGIVTWCEQRLQQGDALREDRLLAGITSLALTGHLPEAAGPVFPDLQERACALLGRLSATGDGR